ncbi:hypothetical protein HK096_007996 [Nowakowskiella sp. JEL0078]|nr:hypothetical protein HK096_007996 [Nowakowskiella sp. JEL0078]
MTSFLKTAYKVIQLYPQPNSSSYNPNLNFWFFPKNSRLFNNFASNFQSDSNSSKTDYLTRVRSTSGKNSFIYLQKIDTTKNYKGLEVKDVNKILSSEYAIRLHGNSKTGLVKHVFRILDNAKIQPDEMTYRIALSSFAEVGDDFNFNEILKISESQGIIFEKQFVAENQFKIAVVKKASADQIDKRFEAFKNTMPMKEQPLLTAMILFDRAKLNDRLDRVFREWLEASSCGAVDLHRDVLMQFRLSEKFERSTEFFRELARRGCGAWRPSVASAGYAIDAYLDLHLAGEAEALLASVLSHETKIEDCFFIYAALRTAALKPLDFQLVESVFIHAQLLGKKSFNTFKYAAPALLLAYGRKSYAELLKDVMDVKSAKPSRNFLLNSILSSFANNGDTLNIREMIKTIGNCRYAMNNFTMQEIILSPFWKPELMEMKYDQDGSLPLAHDLNLVDSAVKEALEFFLYFEPIYATEQKLVVKSRMIRQLAENICYEIAILGSSRMEDAMKVFKSEEIKLGLGLIRRLEGRLGYNNLYVQIIREKKMFRLNYKNDTQK